MPAKKGRGRKPAAVIEEPVVDAGQENVIDSTTESLNAKEKLTEPIVAIKKLKGRKKNDEIVIAKKDEINGTTDKTDKDEVVLPMKRTTAKGRKKNDEIVTEDEINGITDKIDKDEVVLPMKRTRATKTKANNNMKEYFSATSSPVVENNKKKPEIKKNMIDKKKTPTTAGRRGKRAASIEKNIEINEENEENSVEEAEEVLEENIKIDSKKRKVNNVATDTKDNKIKKQPAEKKMKKNATETMIDKKKTPTTTGRRGKRAASIQKNIEINEENEENSVEEAEAVLEENIKIDSKKRKVNNVATDTKDNKIKKQPAEKKMKINATATLYDEIDFSIKEDYNLKISSWNVAGLRAWLTKGGLEYITHEKPDIMCFQELKCAEDQIPDEALVSGYHPYWLCKTGGFNGISIYSKIMPIHVEYGLGYTELDDENRIMTAEYEKFYLICVYVPNSGRKLVTLPKRLHWNEIFHKYIIQLNEKKPVIICGDLNVAHNEIDLANPKANKRNAGFTQEERDGMSQLLSYGFVDTFRHFNPNKKDAYTYWTYMANARAKNVGWRLDYFLVSEKFMPKIVNNVIRSKVLGSDHCPITLFLNI